MPRALTIAAVLGAATVGGVFFAFSTFVMPALRRIDDGHGVRAMQSINVAAPASRCFMAAMLGTGVVSVCLAAWALAHRGHASGPYLLAGAVLYLASVAVTVGYHVPRNDALAPLDPASSATAVAWRAYASGWTMWNHVRTALPLAAAASFVLGLAARRPT